MRIYLLLGFPKPDDVELALKSVIVLQYPTMLFAGSDTHLGASFTPFPRQSDYL